MPTPPVLTILKSNFYLHNRVLLHATVFWDPTNPGQNAVADMTGNRSDGVPWISINGGVAFVHVIRGDGASLRIETWGTDTNGDLSPAAIDIFTLPIDITGPFPPALNNFPIVSPHRVWTYVLTSLAGNPNGFNLDASAAPSNARVSISVN